MIWKFLRKTEWLETCTIHMTSKKHIKISLTSNFNLKCTISWTMLYNYSVSVQPGRGTVQLNQSNRLLSTLTGVSKLGRTTSIYNSLVASHRDGVYLDHNPNRSYESLTTRPIGANRWIFCPISKRIHIFDLDFGQIPYTQYLIQYTLYSIAYT